MGFKLFRKKGYGCASPFASHPGDDEQFQNWLAERARLAARATAVADAQTGVNEDDFPATGGLHALTRYTTVREMAAHYTTHAAHRLDGDQYVPLCLTFSLSGRPYRTISGWIDSRALIDCDVCHRLHDRAASIADMSRRIRRRLTDELNLGIIEGRLEDHNGR